jgi:hypothetical protein
MRITEGERVGERMGSSCSAYLEGRKRRAIREIIETLSDAIEAQDARARHLEGQSDGYEKTKTGLRVRYAKQKTPSGKEIVVMYMRQALGRQKQLRRDIQACLNRSDTLTRQRDSIEDQLRVNGITKAMVQCLAAQKVLEEEVNEDTVIVVMDKLAEANARADGASEHLIRGSQCYDEAETDALEIELQGLLHTDTAVQGGEELDFPAVPTRITVAAQGRGRETAAVASPNCLLDEGA